MKFYFFFLFFLMAPFAFTQQKYDTPTPYREKRPLHTSLENEMEGNENFSPSAQEDWEISSEAGKEEPLPPFSYPFVFGLPVLSFKENFILLGLGGEYMNEVFYSRLYPRLSFHADTWELELGIPFRFPIYDLEAVKWNDLTSYPAGFVGINAMFAPALGHWEKAADILRVFRRVQVASARKDSFLELSRDKPLTLGKGELMRRFIPNWHLSADPLYLFGQFSTEQGGMQAILGPLPSSGLIGFSAYIHPFFYLPPPAGERVKLSVSYIADLEAPISFQPILPVTPVLKMPLTDKGVVHALGLGAQTHVLRHPFLDIEGYCAYNHLFFPSAQWGVAPGEVNQGFQDLGFSMGALAHMTFLHHFLQIQGEGRVFGPRYLPSYFDVGYDIERFFSRGLTRMEFLGRQGDQSWRMGFALELEYAWNQWLGFMIAYEDALAFYQREDPPLTKNLSLQISSEAFSWLQFLAGYHLRDWKDLHELFSFKGENEFFAFQLLIKPFPFMSMDFFVRRLFTFSSFQSAPDTPSPTGLISLWAAGAQVFIGYYF